MFAKLPSSMSILAGSQNEIVMDQVCVDNLINKLIESICLTPMDLSFEDFGSNHGYVQAFVVNALIWGPVSSNALGLCTCLFLPII